MFLGQAISLSTGLLSQPGLIYTDEGPSTEDDSYMGYSVESISFAGTNITGAVVGTPRGDMLSGKVGIGWVYEYARVYRKGSLLFTFDRYY